LLTGPQKSAHCPEHGGAHYGEAHFQQKSLGRTFDRPDKGGAHYREVPTYRGFTVECSTMEMQAEYKGSTSEAQGEYKRSTREVLTPEVSLFPLH
jgi:hypothetical protein